MEEIAWGLIRAIEIKAKMNKKLARLKVVGEKDYIAIFKYHDRIEKIDSIISSLRKGIRKCM